MRRRIEPVVLLRRFARARRGGILTVAAITLPLVLAATALVVDVGTLYAARSKAETVATMAAEAAFVRVDDIEQAKSLARQVALANLFDAGYARTLDITVTRPASNEVIVEVEMSVDTILAGIVGVDDLTTRSVVGAPTPPTPLPPSPDQ